MKIFTGNCPALVTPRNKNGTINYDVLNKLIDFQISNNCSAILLLGTTGEASTISNKDKHELIVNSVKYINKRVPLIVGAGSNNTNDAIKKVKSYTKLDVDGFLIVTPYYNKCTQQGLIEHYTQIAKSTAKPIILYNVPSRTGVNILPNTVLKLSKISNIVGIKEASGNMDQITEIFSLVGKDFSVYSGDDALTLPVLSLGGSGVISVISNILPDVMSNICNSYFNGDISYCKFLQLKYYKLIKLMFCEVNPIPIKYALKLLGFDVGAPFLPLTPLTTPNEQLLINELKYLKIIN